MKKSVAEIVSELVLPYAQQLGYELYDVEYVKEGADYFLRIYIDNAGRCYKLGRLRAYVSCC